MSHSVPSLSGRRSEDRNVGARQDSSAADGPFSPAGLKVLVVDDDPMCLKVVSAMLQRCNYEVETRSNGQEALALLRERHESGTDQFDLVLSDVYMPDMDGFKLLEHIGLELGLPVIMMSSNGDTNVVLRGVTHGAVDFLIKPVRIEELRNVWQHVVRRRSTQISRGGDESAAELDVDSRTHGTKRKGSETIRVEHEVGSGNKKPRVVWSIEMHQQFVNAVNVLGIDKAVPKRILDLMNVEGLTRENVASHLQKYRLYLKRVESVAGKGGRRGSFGSGMAALEHEAMEDDDELPSAVGGQDGRSAAALDVQQHGHHHHAAAVMSPQAYTSAVMGPMAAAHVQMAAWQQQTMAMQVAAAAAAASGALPGPLGGAMPAYAAQQSMPPAYGMVSASPYVPPVSQMPPSSSVPSYASHGSGITSHHYGHHGKVQMQSQHMLGHGVQNGTVTNTNNNTNNNNAMDGSGSGTNGFDPGAQTGHTMHTNGQNGHSSNGAFISHPSGGSLAPDTHHGRGFMVANEPLLPAMHGHEGHGLGGDDSLLTEINGLQGLSPSKQDPENDFLEMFIQGMEGNEGGNAAG